MKMKGLGFGVLGMIVLGMLPVLASAEVPLTFDTTATVTIDVDMYDVSVSDSGTNYATCSVQGGEDPHRYNGSGTISCLSATAMDEAATIEISGHGKVNHGGGCNGSFRVDGNLHIGTTPTCPEGTPVLLSFSSDYNNMFDTPDFGEPYFRISYVNNPGPGDDFYYDMQPPVGTLEIPVYAGDSIWVGLSSSYIDANYEMEMYYGSGTFSFSAEVVPEPTTALLLLAGLPLIRRR